MLHDHLVCGVNDVRIQRRLLAEPDLTFKKAYEIAQAIEMADKDTKDLTAATGTGQLSAQCTERYISEDLLPL